jgi:hypothetical protein
MRFEIKYTSSAGNQESQVVAENDVPWLINKILRLGGVEISVTSPRGNKWTADEALQQLS